MRKRRVLCGCCKTLIREKMTNWPWDRRWKVYYPKGCPCYWHTLSNGVIEVSNVPTQLPDYTIEKHNRFGF
jgi:hypothetical protein